MSDFLDPDPNDVPVETMYDVLEEVDEPPLPPEPEVGTTYTPELKDV